MDDNTAVTLYLCQCSPETGCGPTNQNGGVSASRLPTPARAAGRPTNGNLQIAIVEVRGSIVACFSGVLRQLQRAAGIDSRVYSFPAVPIPTNLPMGFDVKDGTTDIGWEVCR